MVNDEYKKKSSSSSSSSVCEVSMLLVSNIIRLSCRSLFGAQSLPPNYSSNIPTQPQKHERLTAESHHNRDPPRKIKITSDSADSVMVTKPRSYLAKPAGQVVDQTLTRYETNNNNNDVDVDAHAGYYINQVREKINGNSHVD